MMVRRFSVLRGLLMATFSIAGFGVGSLVSAAEDGLRATLALADSHETLTNNGADWREQSVLVGANRAEKLVGYVGARQTQRFDLRDREFSAGLVLSPSSSLTVALDAAKSETHRVLARDAVGGQVALVIGDGWVVGGGYKRSHYDASRSNVANLTLERYFGAWRVGYTGYLSRATATPYASSHRLAANYEFTDDLSAGLSGARGRELENVPGQGLRASLVVNVFASLTWRALRRVPGRPDLWLTLDGGEQKQGELYTRKGARIGARLGF